MSEEKKAGPSGTNTRWWESYLVRYFSGTVVGAVCLTVMFWYVAIQVHKTPRTHDLLDGRDIPTTALAALLFTGGLMYSYIISTPITVIHFGRYGRSSIERQIRYFWLGWVITLLTQNLLFMSGLTQWATDAISFLTILPITAFLYLYFDKSASEALDYRGIKISRRIKRIRRLRRDLLNAIAWAALLIYAVTVITKLLCLQGRPTVIALLTFSLPAVFVGAMQYVTLFRIFSSERSSHRFYRVLTRARRRDGSRDIRETYTHLREHSNATFIVLLELCVSTFVLFFMEVSSSESNGPLASSPINERSILGILTLIAAWMTPNLFIWSRSNQLERDFAKHPNLYTGAEAPKECK